MSIKFYPNAPESFIPSDTSAKLTLLRYLEECNNNHKDYNLTAEDHRCISYLMSSGLIGLVNVKQRIEECDRKGYPLNLDREAYYPYPYFCVTHKGKDFLLSPFDIKTINSGIESKINAAINGKTKAALIVSSIAISISLLSVILLLQ